MMLKIDNNVLEYNKNYDMFCFQNCMYYILRENNINNAEFYINKSMSLIVKSEAENIISSFDKNCYAVLPEYSRNIKKFITADDALNVFNRNLSDVLADKKIIVAVDSYYLHYLPFYKKSHGLHSLIFREYNEKTKRIKVIDNVKPWCFEGYIDVNEFLQARDSSYTDKIGMFTNKPINNMWEEVLLEGWNGKLEDLVFRQIELSLNQYYFPQDVDCSYEKGVNVFPFICDCIKNLQELSMEKQDIQLDGIHKALYKLNHRRRFWGDFLDKIPEEFQTVSLGEYIKKNHSLVKYCELILYKILMLKAKRKATLVDDICKRLNDLIDLEMDCGEGLREYIKECKN